MARVRMKKVYFYKKFERIWHWGQAGLIIALLITGFEIHGVYTLLGYDEAVEIHNFCGLSWLVLYAFIVFWLFTTGEWRQYVPTTKKLLDMVVYYAYGIFRGRAHPVEKQPEAKHNPLQRLAYLGIAAAILPVQMVTGLLYYTYNQWNRMGIPDLGLGAVAAVHTAVAFLLISFVVGHAYLATTGPTVFSLIKAMITGWEDVPDNSAAPETDTGK